MNTSQEMDFNPLTKAFKSGDTIICQIQHRTTGGFVVALPRKDIRCAFLPTCLDFRIGLPLEVFFVNEENGKLVFSLTEDEFRKHAKSKTRALSTF